MRDFSSIERIEYEGKVYLVGWVPHAIWRRHSLEAAEAIRKATRRALIRAREDVEGKEPDEDTIQFYRYMDAAYQDEMENGQVELVRWALRGIEGEDVPKETAEHHGRKWEVVKQDFVFALAEDPRLLGRLYTAATEKNALTEGTRKNSPPPSPTAQGDGGATSA